MRWFGILLPLAVLVLAPRPPADGVRADDPAAFRDERAAMVASQLADRDISDPRVRAAMGKVPRHLFVAPALAWRAYEDNPLSIDSGQTISQPYIVALMTQLLELKWPGARVLEIGTGSGYQAAVLAELGAEVYSVEILPALAESAAARLKKLGYRGVRVRAGDGYMGWPEHAPYDGIVVTAACPEVPPPLVAQLAEGGRMALPLEARFGGEDLVVVEKKDGAVTSRRVIPVRFVPLTGPRGQAP
ncbi:MAG: protein-L-isoaspartate(D-aspartate) O-methyltransferase [Chlamydiota bacterium]